ncbi:dockerin type I repeat protein [Pelomyxa schiedti]|nr:dockerin type I repeat protein [Pelomyxa schiedti]
MWTGRMGLAYMDARTLEGDPNFVWSGERFQWLCGYKDPSGVTVDRMFDSLLLIAYEWKDGKMFWPGEGEVPMNQTDWEEYRQLQFDAGVYNIDEAQGAVKTDLDMGIDMGVVFMIPYPDRTQDNWGTINGQAIDFMHSNDDRITACEWYIDGIISMWAAAPPKHTRLMGFYWYLECVDDNEDERVLISTVGKYIHSLSGNYGFHWIPFYGAGGLEYLSTYGFDVVSMQPGYAFYNVAEVATQMHMGMELEISLDEWNPNVPDWQTNFMAYLNASVAYHFNTQAMLTFYYANDFTTMGQNPEYRPYYDLLYWLIRGSYPNSP